MVIDNYPPVLRAYFRMVGQIWLEKIEAELWKYSQELNDWLYDLFLHQSDDWRKRLAFFEAAQESEGRTLTPESRTALLGFLEGWAHENTAETTDSKETKVETIAEGVAPHLQRGLAIVDSSEAQSRKRIAVQQVAIGRKAVGHHWTPLSVIADPDIIQLLTNDAKIFAIGSYSGPTDPHHNFGTFGGVTHSRYNSLVKDELKLFITTRSITAANPMTAAQMKEFIELVNSGLGASGEVNDGIAAFNNAIKKAVRKTAKAPSSFEEIMAAGRRQIKQPRFAKLLTGALLLSLLGDQLAGQTEVLALVGDSKQFKRAILALREGDLDRARTLLIGSINSVHMEIVLSGKAVAALNFKTLIETIFELAPK